MSGRLFAGRIGRTDMPPDTAVDSGRVREVPAAAVDVVAVEALDVPDTLLAGEMCAMAEPGRAGRFFVAMARFCASMASLRLGLDEVMVLLDSPKPGRATGAASTFLAALGLFWSFCSSFCAVPSRFSMMLSTFVSNSR
jgi:hypothetical protein